MRVRFVSAVAIVLTTLSSSAAWSQQPARGDDRALAETLFFTARGMMEAKRYADACPKLAESYRLDPAAGTLINLGVCDEQIGKIASAWGELKQSLAEARRANNQGRIELASERIAAIEPELPFLSIEVPAAARVPGLEVLRNGTPIQAAGWATELPVDPGRVEIVARAPGYKTKTRTLTLARRQHLTIQLEKLDLAPVVVLAPSETGSHWTGRKTAGVMLAGLGLVAVAGGAFFGLNAISERKTSDSDCPVFDAERRCTSAGADAMSQARTAAWISDVSFGVGALALAAGAYFFFSGGQSEPALTTASAPPAWSFSARAGATGAEGTLTHAF